MLSRENTKIIDDMLDDASAFAALLDTMAELAYETADDLGVAHQDDTVRDLYNTLGDILEEASLAAHDTVKKYQ